MRGAVTRRKRDAGRERGERDEGTAVERKLDDLLVTHARPGLALSDRASTSEVTCTVSPTVPIMTKSTRAFCP